MPNFKAHFTERSFMVERRQPIDTLYDTGREPCVYLPDESVVGIGRDDEIQDLDALLLPTAAPETSATPPASETTSTRLP